MRTKEAGENLLPGDDAQAHERAMSAPIEDVVRLLTDILGAPAVADIGGVQETRAVAQWMHGRGPQRPHVLRFALQLALTLVHPSDVETARAWFHGSNPYLADHVPIVMLRTKPLHEIQHAMLIAARSFAARRREAEA